jgi:integrase
LEWRHVDLIARELRPRSTNRIKKVPVVPLRGKLLEIIERAHTCRRTWCPFVFHGPRCKPIDKAKRECFGDFRKVWWKALKAAGLPESVIAHDQRRSAITNMRRAGIPESVAMRISGHKTRSVFERYNIIGTRDIEQGLDQLDSYVEREAGKVKVVPLK